MKRFLKRLIAPIIIFFVWIFLLWWYSENKAGQPTYLFLIAIGGFAEITSIFRAFNTKKGGK